MRESLLDPLSSETAIEIITIFVLSILFIATLMRSAFGFGEALVAVPLLAFCIPLNQAAPLAVLVSITIAAIVVLQDWKKFTCSAQAGSYCQPLSASRSVFFF
jgi:uncharacterized membrane protein YfcA